MLYKIYSVPSSLARTQSVSQYTRPPNQLENSSQYCHHNYLSSTCHSLSRGNMRPVSYNCLSPLCPLLLRSRLAYPCLCSVCARLWPVGNVTPSEANEAEKHNTRVSLCIDYTSLYQLLCFMFASHVPCAVHCEVCRPVETKHSFNSYNFTMLFPATE